MSIELFDQFTLNESDGDSDINSRPGSPNPSDISEEDVVHDTDSAFPNRGPLIQTHNLNRNVNPDYFGSTGIDTKAHIDLLREGILAAKVTSFDNNDSQSEDESGIADGVDEEDRLPQEPVVQPVKRELGCGTPSHVSRPVADGNEESPRRRSTVITKTEPGDGQKGIEERDFRGQAEIWRDEMMHKYNLPEYMRRLVTYVVECDTNDEVTVGILNVIGISLDDFFELHKLYPSLIDSLYFKFNTWNSTSYIGQFYDYFNAYITPIRCMFKQERITWTKDHTLAFFATIAEYSGLIAYDANEVINHQMIIDTFCGQYDITPHTRSLCKGLPYDLFEFKNKIRMTMK